MGIRVLLVDDELGTLKPLIQHLLGAGYDLRTASDLEGALHLVRTASPDLVILDIRFGRTDRLGLDILKEIRIGLGDQTTPVLMLTGAGEDELEPLSFELGATDFVSKSAGTRALLARIRARILRPLSEPILVDERLRIDLAQAEVHVARSGRWQTVRLEPKQAQVLKKLVSNPGRVLRREQLEDLFDEAEDPARALNTCISRLREILEPDPHDPTYVQTRRGIGYKFRNYR